MKRHREPTEATAKILFGSASVCGFPECAEPIVEHHVPTDTYIVNADIAHICARSEGGPRWKDAQTEEENRSPNNLLLLCKKHAALIDKKALESFYTEDVLRQWKKDQIAKSPGLDMSRHYEAAFEAWADRKREVKHSCLSKASVVSTEFEQKLSDTTVDEKQTETAITITISAAGFDEKLKPVLDADFPESVRLANWNYKVRQGESEQRCSHVDEITRLPTVNRVLQRDEQVLCLDTTTNRFTEQTGSAFGRFIETGELYFLKRLNNFEGGSKQLDVIDLIRSVNDTIELFTCWAEKIKSIDHVCVTVSVKGIKNTPLAFDRRCIFSHRRELKSGLIEDNEVLSSTLNSIQRAVQDRNEMIKDACATVLKMFRSPTFAPEIWLANLDIGLTLAHVTTEPHFDEDEIELLREVDKVFGLEKAIASSGFDYNLESHNERADAFASFMQKRLKEKRTATTKVEEPRSEIINQIKKYYSELINNIDEEMSITNKSISRDYWYVSFSEASRIANYVNRNRWMVERVVNYTRRPLRERPHKNMMERLKDLQYYF